MKNLEISLKSLKSTQGLRNGDTPLYTLTWPIVLSYQTRVQSSETEKKGDNTETTCSFCVAHESHVLRKQHIAPNMFL